MLSVGMGIECQANLNAAVLRLKLPQQNLPFVKSVNQRALNLKPKTSSSSVSHSMPELRLGHTRAARNVRLSAAAESLVAEETATADTAQEKENCSAFLPGFCLVAEKVETQKTVTL
ncbi:hypothetical protein C1H46_030536 [Malus baccata]|uniref:Uncharacterized protein n=1 Tax=Malus baccata TaxID=106549 RepID=A0A540LBR6_MALBA|nr:hypothetical protein C1H46_030536 [Malus baccata]